MSDDDETDVDVDVALDCSEESNPGFKVEDEVGVGLDSIPCSTTAVVTTHVVRTLFLR